ncbi:MAG: hypothetical protein M3Q44_07625 [bacterium]|nr:hypothetical protein [bacterium]
MSDKPHPTPHEINKAVLMSEIKQWVPHTRRALSSGGVFLVGLFAGACAPAEQRPTLVRPVEASPTKTPEPSWTPTIVAATALSRPTVLPIETAVATASPSPSAMLETESHNSVLFEFDINTPRDILEGEGGDSLGQWWLTSGGVLHIKEGVLQTPDRDTTKDDRWYHANANSSDPAKITKPEIVNRGFSADSESESWSDYSITTIITPTENMVTTSPEVDGTDGIDLFIYAALKRNTNGGLDYNTYVAYLTKDGRIMIKKRYVNESGEILYGLIAERKLLKGTYVKGQSLIPIGHPILLRASAQSDNGSTEIAFLVDIPPFEGFNGVSGAVGGIDDGNLRDEEGGKGMGAAYNKGRAGLRTDSLRWDLNSFTVTPISAEIISN